MYERFTDRSRKVMQLAFQEAHRLNHEYVGTEHILLGLVKEGSGVAVAVLRSLGVEPGTIAAEIGKLIHKGTPLELTERLPQTPRAKAVIKYSLEEAGILHHKYVGTEHILLGLLREEEGVAAQVLMNLGLPLEKVRAAVRAFLGVGDAGGNEYSPQSRSQWVEDRLRTVGKPPESVTALVQTIVLMAHGTDGRFPWERGDMRAAAYSRDLAAGRLLPFDEKFSGLLRMCEQAKKGEFEILIVAGPETLGDDYEELLGNLRRLAEAGLLVAIAEQKGP